MNQCDPMERWNDEPNGVKEMKKKKFRKENGTKYLRKENEMTIFKIFCSVFRLPSTFSSRVSVSVSECVCLC